MGKIKIRRLAFSLFFSAGLISAFLFSVLPAPADRARAAASGAAAAHAACLRLAGGVAETPGVRLFRFDAGKVIETNGTAGDAADHVRAVLARAAAGSGTGAGTGDSGTGDGGTGSGDSGTGTGSGDGGTEASAWLAPAALREAAAATCADAAGGAHCLVAARCGGGTIYAVAAVPLAPFLGAPTRHRDTWAEVLCAHAAALMRLVACAVLAALATIVAGRRHLGALERLASLAARASARAGIAGGARALGSFTRIRSLAVGFAAAPGAGPQQHHGDHHRHHGHHHPINNNSTVHEEMLAAGATATTSGISAFTISRTGTGLGTVGTLSGTVAGTGSSASTSSEVAANGARTDAVSDAGSDAVSDAEPRAPGASGGMGSAAAARRIGGGISVVVPDPAGGITETGISRGDISSATVTPASLELVTATGDGAGRMFGRDDNDDGGGGGRDTAPPSPLVVGADPENPRSQQPSGAPGAKPGRRAGLRKRKGPGLSIEMPRGESSRDTPPSARRNTPTTLNGGNKFIELALPAGGSDTDGGGSEPRGDAAASQGGSWLWRSTVAPAIGWLGRLTRFGKREARPRGRSRSRRSTSRAAAAAAASGSSETARIEPAKRRGSCLRDTRVSPSALTATVSNSSLASAASESSSSSSGSLLPSVNDNDNNDNEDNDSHAAAGTAGTATAAASAAAAMGTRKSAAAAARMRSAPSVDTTTGVDEIAALEDLYSLTTALIKLSDTLPHGVVALGPRGETWYASPAFRRLFMCGAGEDVAALVWGLVSSDPELYRRVASAVAVPDAYAEYADDDDDDDGSSTDPAGSGSSAAAGAGGRKQSFRRRPYYGGSLLLFSSLRTPRSPPAAGFTVAAAQGDAPPSPSPAIDVDGVLLELQVAGVSKVISVRVTRGEYDQGSQTEEFPWLVHSKRKSASVSRVGSHVALVWLSV